MELKIKVAFTDKYTKDDYSIDEVITVDQARGEELLADDRNLVELIKEAPKRKKAGAKNG